LKAKFLLETVGALSIIFLQVYNATSSPEGSNNLNDADSCLLLQMHVTIAQTHAWVSLLIHLIFYVFVALPVLT